MKSNGTRRWTPNMSREQRLRAVDAELDPPAAVQGKAPPKPPPANAEDDARFAALLDQERREKLRERVLTAVDEHELDVLHEAERLTVRREARALVDAEGFTRPEDDGSLDDQFRNPAPEPSFLVEQLLPAKGIVTVNAQYKAGKTTVAINLAGDLASGAPFLGAYPVARRCVVALWNLEMDKARMQSWLFGLGLSRAARKRVHPKHLRGSGIDLMSRAGRDWTVEWLRERSVDVWIIDPQSKLYRGAENDNSEYNAWWRTVEEIMGEADVQVCVIIHHAGHANGAGDADALPRGRGASAMGGNPDAFWTYRHGGDLGAVPASGDTRRYLAAFGRDVDVPEFTLDYDPATHRLHAIEGAPTRAQDKREQLAVRAYDVVAEATSAGRKPNRTELLDALVGAKRNTKAGRAANSAIDLVAQKRGWLTWEKGPHNSQLFSLGDVDPRRVDLHVTKQEGGPDE